MAKIRSLRFSPSRRWPAGVAVNGSFPVLATLGEHDTVVHLWEMDLGRILAQSGPRSTHSRRRSGRGKGLTQYQNAKVLLIGNSSVGKSGLGLVLAGKKWKATDSTHARHLWRLAPKKVDLGNGGATTQETFLWDLAGQPGYRIVHGLHLSEAAVALVCFDSSSELDPFGGVVYWARALDEATDGFPLVKFLVAARCDRGAPQVSKERIEYVCKQYGFTGFHLTSARRGDGIVALRKAIVDSIAWTKLPHISAEFLFKKFEAFCFLRRGQEKSYAQKMSCVPASDGNQK